MDSDIVRDLLDDLDHGRFTAARAEERKHVDRAIDRPVDVFVEQGFEIGGLAFFDPAMQWARKTPEAVLCHFSLVLELACKQQRPLWASASTLWQVAGVHYLKLQ